MVNISKNVLNTKIKEKINELLIVHVLRMKTKKQAKNLVYELLTPTERIQLAKRFAILSMLNRNHETMTISNTLKVSRTTIGSVEDKMEKGGYDSTIKELQRSSSGDFSEIIETLIEFSLFKGGKTRLKYFKQSMDERYKHVPKKKK